MAAPWGASGWRIAISSLRASNGHREFAWHPSISGSGNVVVYQCECGSPSLSEVHANDLSTGTTTVIGELPDGTIPDGQDQVGFASTSFHSVSSDGSYVVFDSWATNLIPADTNDTGDVYIERLS